MCMGAYIYNDFPVGKIAEIAEKAVCRSVFLTIWHYILSVELTKTHSFRLFFLAIFPTVNDK